MAMRCIVMAKNHHRSQDFDTFRIRFNKDHAVPVLARRILIAGLHHDNINRAAGIARARRPVFFTVEDIMIPVQHRAHFKVGRVRRRHVGFGHQVG